MSYLKYSNLCADMVRSVLKEPARGKAKARETVYFRSAIWKDGKPEKQSKRGCLQAHSIQVRPSVLLTLICVWQSSRTCKRPQRTNTSSWGAGGDWWCQTMQHICCLLALDTAGGTGCSIVQSCRVWARNRHDMSWCTPSISMIQSKMRDAPTAPCEYMPGHCLSWPLTMGCRRVRTAAPYRHRPTCLCSYWTIRQGVVFQLGLYVSA